MMSHPQRGKPGRPLGLMLLSALLLILALRTVGWVAIGGFMERRLPGPARWLVSLPLVAVFLVGAAGLMRLWRWARWLALATYTAYFGMTLVNVVAMWPRLQANRTSLVLGILNATEAVTVLALAWWYLNRQDVRRLFRKRQ